MSEIKELRAKSGMTQKQFSEFVGCSKRAVEDWEGCRRMCPEYVKNLIEYKLVGENLINKKDGTN